jgi:hypothetical protein
MIRAIFVSTPLLLRFLRNGLRSASVLNAATKESREAGAIHNATTTLPTPECVIVSGADLMSLVIEF